MLLMILVVLLVLLFISLPVAAALGYLALFLDAFYNFLPLHRGFGTKAWATQSDILLVAVPLFILLGELLLRSGIADRMYRAMMQWLSWLPGGLMHANVGASMCFAATAGSSVATAATISTVAVPLVRRYRYNKRLFLGSTRCRRHARDPRILRWPGRGDPVRILVAGAARQTRHHHDPVDLQRRGEAKCLADDRVVPPARLARRELVAGTVEGTDREAMILDLGQELAPRWRVLEQSVRVEGGPGTSCRSRIRAFRPRPRPPPAACHPTPDGPGCRRPIRCASAGLPVVRTLEHIRFRRNILH